MKPHRVHANASRKTSVLFFQGSAAGIEFYMRGGICWPMLVEREHGAADVQGYAIMAGLEIGTGIVRVFEETDFVSVEHILNSDNTIEHRGLAAWLNGCWSGYYADTFFWNQGDKLTRKYRLEVSRSQWCKPKPHFVEIVWQDEAEARQLVWRYVKLGKLRVSRDGQLAREMEAAKMEKVDDSPALHALHCVLAGLERYPWRGDRKQKKPQIVWA